MNEMNVTKMRKYLVKSLRDNKLCVSHTCYVLSHILGAWEICTEIDSYTYRNVVEKYWNAYPFYMLYPIYNMFIDKQKLM